MNTIRAFFDAHTRHIFTRDDDNNKGRKSAPSLLPRTKLALFVDGIRVM